jgi:hypothetical protein
MTSPPSSPVSVPGLYAATKCFAPAKETSFANVASLRDQQSARSRYGCELSFDSFFSRPIEAVLGVHPDSAAHGVHPLHGGLARAGQGRQPQSHQHRDHFPDRSEVARASGLREEAQPFEQPQVQLLTRPQLSPSPLPAPQRPTHHTSYESYKSGAPRGAAAAGPSHNGNQHNQNRHNQNQHNGNQHDGNNWQRGRGRATRRQHPVQHAAEWQQMPSQMHMPQSWQYPQQAVATC